MISVELYQESFCNIGVLCPSKLLFFGNSILDDEIWIHITGIQEIVSLCMSGSTKRRSPENSYTIFYGF